MRQEPVSVKNQIKTKIKNARDRDKMLLKKCTLHKQSRDTK